MQPDPEGDFRALYESCYGHVHAYACRRLGRDGADEVAAETFAIAWRRREVVPAEPLPWLYGVARNVVLRRRTDAARQAGVRIALERERPPACAEEDEAEEVWAAWGRLRETEREVLALIAWEDLTVRDAAAVLGCTAAVFSVRLHRARRRFERLLAEPRPRAASRPALSEVS